MTDVFTRRKRSEVMSRIRGRDNRDTELRLATLLRKNRISGWRRHLPLPGRPDFSFPQRRLAIFVDGCFWHGCPKCYQAPKQNAKFWKTKILVNKTRDRKVNRLLKQSGWRVIRIWECRLAASHVHSVVRIEKVLNETV